MLLNGKLPLTIGGGIGPERGIIPELSDVCYTYSYEDVEILQARGADGLVKLDDATDNVGVAINPIA